MTKFTKYQLAEHDTVCNQLTDKFTDLEMAIDAFNEALAKAWEPLEAALSNYNDAISEANVFAEGIVSDMQEYSEGKSDKWKEGDRGTAYSAWMAQWDESLYACELSKPDDIDIANIENYSEDFGFRQQELEP